MDFWIQTGSPEARDVFDLVNDIDGALREMYPVDTEQMVLSWNGLPVSLVYCEDVQVIIDDVVVMLESLARGTADPVRVYWGPSAFQVEWRIVRQGDDLVIDSKWYVVEQGPGEDLLNERGRLVVPEAHFRREWLKVLRRVVDDITANAVRLEGTLVFDRARALLAAEAPAAPAERAAPASEREPISFFGDGNDVLWLADPDVALLFTWQAALVAELVGAPSGISRIYTGGDVSVDPGVLADFCARALARYARTDQGIERSLTVGFLATCLELLRRCGRDVPALDSAEQRAAWTALREQHGAQMPR